MAEILLKYLTDLPSATSVDDGDLLHVNQNGLDKSLAIEVLRRAIIDVVYPPNSGKVAFFAKNFNPNDYYQGTTWVRVPGAGNTIRISNESASDVLSTGGSDTVTLTQNNIPAHSHGLDLETAQFDHGTKNTSSGGLHSHKTRINREATQRGGNITYGDESTDGADELESSYAGEHTHTVPIGPHTHRLSGNTESSGLGNSFSITNKYTKLSAWYRSA